MTDPEILQFLAEVAEAFANTNARIARGVTRRVFGIICQPEWQEKSREILNILTRARVGRQDILKECKQRLQEPASQSFIVSVLKGFILDGLNPVKKIRSAVLRAISVDLSDRYLLLDLYAVSLSRASQPITLPILAAFLKTGSLDPVWAMLHKLFDLVGTDAIHPDGISCLVTILVNYDYHHVTSNFSQFLGSFLLILNVRDSVIKPFGYQTQGIVKKIPSIFALAKLPIVQFELLVKAFITVDDENMSSRFLSQMLQLVRWTDNLSNEDLTRYLLASLKHGLEGTSLHRRRCLVFLNDYLTKVESGYDIRAFGASRHSNKTLPPPTSIFIANQNKQVVGELPISLTSSGHVLKNRVAMALGRDPNSFILKFQGQKLFEHRSLMDAELRNSQTVEVHDLPQNHRRAPPFILPSIVLANENFQDVLIQILSADCDASLTGVAWQLLQWLPSSTSLSFEPSNGDNEYLTLYRLHLRLNHLRNLSVDDVGHMLSRLFLRWSIEMRDSAIF
jgi:hypothetical protein